MFNSTTLLIFTLGMYNYNNQRVAHKNYFRTINNYIHMCYEGDKAFILQRLRSQ